MGPSPLSSPRQKYRFQSCGINNRGFNAQIGRYWIEMGSRLPQRNIQWQQVLGPSPFPASQNQQPLAAFLKSNKTYLIARAVVHRWEGHMRQALCLLARKKDISLVIFADPRQTKRLLESIEPSQPSIRPKYKRIIQSFQETYSQSEQKIQQILIKQQIVRENRYQSAIFQQALQYLINILSLNRSQRMETSIFLTVELQHQRMDGMVRIGQIISNQQQRLLEASFTTLIASAEARKEKEALMDSELLQYIHETCERNWTIRAELAHFLVPYAVLLRMLQRKSPAFAHSPYISRVIHFISKQMAKPEIKFQMGPSVHESFPEMITEERTYEELREYMRMVLVTQKRLMGQAVPFYYNFFALVVNQEVYFKRGREELLEYTVNFQYPKFNPAGVGWEQVFGAIARMEVALRERYHSKYV